MNKKVDMILGETKNSRKERENCADKFSLDGSETIKTSYNCSKKPSIFTLKI